MGGKAKDTIYGGGGSDLLYGNNGKGGLHSINCSGCYAIKYPYLPRIYDAFCFFFVSIVFTIITWSTKSNNIVASAV